MDKEQKPLGGANAGGETAFSEKEQVASIADNEFDATSLGKFADEKALLKAYNELEAEFTKRSQRLSALERENSLLKQEQAEENFGKDEVVQDETGSAAEERKADSVSCEDDGAIAAEVNDFLKRYPEAATYAEQIALAADAYDSGCVGILDRAYIEVLKRELAAEREKINDDFIYSQAKNTPEVKERLIRDYLTELSGNKGVKLISRGGESVVTPPEKPKSIAEAGKMAAFVLKKI